MAKLRLTKNELKKQKDGLKRFVRYLPTLELKKTQLLAEIRRIQESVERLEEEISRLESGVKRWVGVFAEEVDVRSLFDIVQIVTGVGNIAGSDIPLFENIIFEDKEYDYMQYPLWVDRAVIAVKQVIKIKAELEILQKQQEIIKEELRTTVQRINLFEKVMIPRTKENIRKIRIFLGDEQTAAVVRGKIAKTKLEKKKTEEQFSSSQGVGF